MPGQDQLKLPCSYKKSLEDYKARLKLNEPPHLKTSSSASNIPFLELLSPSEENDSKILMSPIGFARNEEKKYENSIYSKIRFINRKHSEYSLQKPSPEKLDRGSFGGVFDDNGRTEALIRRKYNRKKNKSEIDFSQKFEVNFKAAISQRNNSNSKHYDKVDLALLGNNEYFEGKKDGFFEGKKDGFEGKKDVFLKIRTMQGKKSFVFPKITMAKGVS